MPMPAASRAKEKRRLALVENTKSAPSGRATGDKSFRNSLQQIRRQFWIQGLQNVILLHRAYFFAGTNVNDAQRVLCKNVLGFELDYFAQQLDRFLRVVLF